MFSLTEAGHEAIRQFTSRAPKPAVIRDELAVKVLAADAGDASAVRDFVAERLQWATAKLERYERFRARLLDGRTEDDYLAQTERVGPYLTLLRGISFEQENIRWAERVLTIIDRRLRTRGPSDSGRAPAATTR
jgi:hypothetical protein